MRRRFLAAALLLASFGMTAGAAAEPLKIVFVDTGNTGRSVTAEALAKDMIQKQHLPIAVISRAVSLDPSYRRAEPNVVKLLAERGIDVSQHSAEALTAADVADADLVLTMTANHRAKVMGAFPGAEARTYTLSNYATGQAADVEDAKDRPFAVYQSMVDQVARLVPLALSKALSHTR